MLLTNNVSLFSALSAEFRGFREGRLQLQFLLPLRDRALTERKQVGK